jgi:hypothetical protein
VHEFLRSHPFNENHKPEQEIPFIDLSEDAQMEVAIKASLQASQTPSTQHTSTKEMGQKKLEVKAEPSPIESQIPEKKAVVMLDETAPVKRKLTNEATPGAKQPKIEPLKAEADTTVITTTTSSSSTNETNGGDCTIQIRESNGNTLKRNFFSTQTVADIYDWISKKRTDDPKIPFRLVTPFPTKALEGDLKQMTLKDAQLTPRAVLIVQLITP